MATRRHFSREFKVEAVKLVTERGVSWRRLRVTGRSRDVLRKWVRRSAGASAGVPWQGRDEARGG
jgi:transposase